MLKEESEGGMMIAHCSGAREKEQFWSKMLRIMGDAQSSLVVTTKAVAGGHRNHHSVCGGAYLSKRLLRQSRQELCIEGHVGRGA